MSVNLWKGVKRLCCWVWMDVDATICTCLLVRAFALQATIGHAWIGEVDVKSHLELLLGLPAFMKEEEEEEAVMVVACMYMGTSNPPMYYSIVVWR